jgi:hypothetical protein
MPRWVTREDTVQEPYRVLVSGAGGAVISLRHFRTADVAAEYVRGVMVGYWWRPVSLEYGAAPRPKSDGMPQTRLEVRWRDEVLVDRTLQELNADHLKPLVEMWRKKGAA